MLPIGSVVVLKGGTKTLMVFGRKQMSTLNNEVWDYLGCFYPEGSIGPEYCFLFNEEDIDKIIFMGYSNESNKKYEQFLKDNSKTYVYRQEQNAKPQNESKQTIELLKAQNRKKGTAKQASAKNAEIC